MIRCFKFVCWYCLFALYATRSFHVQCQPVPCVAVLSFISNGWSWKSWNIWRYVPWTPGRSIGAQAGFSLDGPFLNETTEFSYCFGNSEVSSFWSWRKCFESRWIHGSCLVVQAAAFLRQIGHQKFCWPFRLRIPHRFQKRSKVQTAEGFLADTCRHEALTKDLPGFILVLGNL